MALRSSKEPAVASGALPCSRHGGRVSEANLRPPRRSRHSRPEHCSPTKQRSGPDYVSRCKAWRVTRELDPAPWSRTVSFLFHRTTNIDQERHGNHGLCVDDEPPDLPLRFPAWWINGAAPSKIEFERVPQTHTELTDVRREQLCFCRSY